jgi:hypothetical protein
VARLTKELDELKNPIDTHGFPVLKQVQLRLGVLAAGIIPDFIDEKIAEIKDETQRVQIATYWHYAERFHRNSPMVAAMVAALGLTEEQVDTLWRAAGTIQ